MLPLPCLWSLISSLNNLLNLPSSNPSPMDSFWWLWKVPFPQSLESPLRRKSARYRAVFWSTTHYNCLTSTINWIWKTAWKLHEKSHLWEFVEIVVFGKNFRSLGVRLFWHITLEWEAGKEQPWMASYLIIMTLLFPVDGEKLSAMHPIWRQSCYRRHIFHLRPFPLHLKFTGVY